MKKDRTIRADLLMQPCCAEPTEAARLAALQRAVYENLQTLSYLISHLDEDNFKDGVWASLASDAAAAASAAVAASFAAGQNKLCPRDEETGEPWQFRGGHIFCGSRCVI